MSAWRRRAVWLLRRRGFEVRRVAPSVALVAREGADVDVRELGRGAALVTHRARARKHWFEQERVLSRYLGAEHVAALLRMCRVDCVLDVGAHHGEYARRLRRAGYRGRVVSFEPVPDAFAKLERAAASDPEWVAYPYALGREDGTTSMNVTEGTFSSMLEPTPFGSTRYAALREPRQQEVEVRRLDRLLDEVVPDASARRIYLKLDTQGYDLEVFAGLGDRTGAVVAMQSEVALLPIYGGMPRMCEALDVYEAEGFGVTGMFPVSRQSRTARVLEFDCVLVRAAAL